VQALPAALTAEELTAFFRREFPQMRGQIEQVGDRAATLRFPVGDGDLRPGGTVSGPTLMMVADTALYAAILGEIGLVALAVTTNLNINFLRKPAAGCDIVAHCRLIKLGKLLAIGEVSLYSARADGIDLNEPVAHATGTYAIPPRR